MRALLVAATLLVGCKVCGSHTSRALRIVDASLSVVGVTGATVVTVGSAGMALDAQGHVVLPAKETLYLDANDDESTASADATTIASALAATSVDLSTAHQVLPAGTAFTLPASGESGLSGIASLSATVAADPTTPLTLVLMGSVPGAGVMVSGTAPYAYDDAVPVADATCD